MPQKLLEFIAYYNNGNGLKQDNKKRNKVKKKAAVTLQYKSNVKLNSCSAIVKQGNKVVPIIVTLQYNCRIMIIITRNERAC